MGYIVTGCDKIEAHILSNCGKCRELEKADTSINCKGVSRIYPAVVKWQLPHKHL